MIRFWKVICLFLVSFLLLCSCNQGAEEDFFFGTTATRSTSRATESQPQKNPTPTKLTPEIYESGEILSRLTDKPYVVDIGGSGVTVELAYQGWPTICRGDGDTLYATSSLRIGHVDPFSVTAFYVSHDSGKTWSEPMIINDTPLDDRDTGVVYMGGGKLLVSFFTVNESSFLDNGEYNTDWGWGYSTPEQRVAKRAEWSKLGSAELAKYRGSFVLLSDDYGKTWSEPIKVPWCDPHGPSLMKNGRTLIAPGLVSDTSGTKFCTYISRDFGKTWSLNSTVKMPQLPNDENTWGYFEPHVIQLSDGSYLGGIRICTTKGPANSVETYGIFVTKSHDGKNWTTPEKIEGLVGSPPHFFELDNGVVLLTYSYRIGNRGSRGRLSYDGGQTWDEEEIVISEITSERNSDVGYPSTVQLADGSLLTIYYQAYGNDYPTSILYTRWRLNEVAE